MTEQRHSAEALSGFAAHHDAFVRGAGDAPGWVQRVRHDAIAAFAAHGFPTTRHEEWKYTSVKALVGSDLVPATPGAATVSAARLKELGVVDLGGPRLVFVDGAWAPSLSSSDGLPERVQLGSLAAAIAERPDEIEPFVTAADPAYPFALLNAAFLRDGAFLRVPRGVVVEKPIHLVFVSASAGTVTHPRVVLVVEDHAQASVVETWVGADQLSLSNAVTDAFVGEAAILDHTRVQREGASAFHVARVHATVARQGTFRSHSISLGALLARHDVETTLSGEGASCVLNGLYLARDRQHVDFHTAIDHAQPRCSSRQVYKGILDGRATAVFNGKVFVRPDAQHTDAQQANKNLMLSERATVNTKPQLEIWADDVRCSHGATIGRLDADALFYLQSRGIPQAEARRLLTYAFANDVVDDVKQDALRDALGAELQGWLPQA